MIRTSLLRFYSSAGKASVRDPQAFPLARPVKPRPRPAPTPPPSPPKQTASDRKLTVFESAQLYFSRGRLLEKLSKEKEVPAKLIPEVQEYLEKKAHDSAARGKEGSEQKPRFHHVWGRLRDIESRAKSRSNEFREIPRHFWKGIPSFLFYSAACFMIGHLFFEHVVEVGAIGGASMLPTMYVEGEWVVMNRRYRRGKGIRVGDLVHAAHPLNPEERILKRVIGMPGDFVLADSVETSGRMIQVPQGHCFLSGDNQAASRDSRHYGPIPLALIRAKVVFRILPLQRMGRLENTFKPVMLSGSI